MNKINKIVVAPSYKVADVWSKVLGFNSHESDVLVLTRFENAKGFNFTEMQIKESDVIIMFGEDFDYPENKIDSVKDYHNYKQLVNVIWQNFKSDSFTQSLLD